MLLALPLVNSSGFDKKSSADFRFFFTGGTGIIATIGFSEPGIKSAKWVYKHAVSAALATGQGLKEFPGDGKFFQVKKSRP